MLSRSRQSFLSSRALVSLVCLGIVLRLWRFGQNFPLWGDESLLADNLLQRGYRELMQPLANWQVAPIGFLWLERLAITTFGFHEWSLRLQGLCFSLLGMVLFARLAVLALDRRGAMCATATFAISYFAIRYAAETKPYAGDLCFATAYLLLAGEWSASGKARWLWGLAALTPIAFCFSFPAVFVAGGVSLGLLPFLIGRFRKGDLRTREFAAYAVFNVVIAGTFLGLQWLVLGEHYRASSESMTAYWKEGFPPGLAEPGKLLFWVWDVGTSAMFAVPFGGERSGSVLSTAFFVAGMIALWKGNRRLMPWIAVGILGLAVVAAALRRYPFGVHPRMVQYFAPMVAVGVGAGVAWFFELVTSRVSERVQRGIVRSSVAGLAVISAVIVARDIARPYQSRYDEVHRGFAAWFWNERKGETIVCLSNNLPTGLFTGDYLAAYRCYRALSMPAQRREAVYRSEAELPKARLKCVAFHLEEWPLNQEVYDAWMKRMEERYRFLGRTVLRVDLRGAPDPLTGCYDVFEFEPK